MALHWGSFVPAASPPPRGKCVHSGEILGARGAAKHPIVHGATPGREFFGPLVNVPRVGSPMPHPCVVNPTGQRS